MNKINNKIFNLSNILIAQSQIITQQNLIQIIFKINSIQKEKQFVNFLSSTFQFYSPTFNNQYLTFNYIYNDPKQYYFYQNYHYSHSIIQIYKQLLENLLDKYKSLQQKCKEPQTNNNNSTDIFKKIFNHLRNNLGYYAKQHLIQANSKQFYQYLNLCKFYYVTITKQFLTHIQTNQIILFFDLIINQIIIKQNHPLIRQYIEVILARSYFFIKEKSYQDKNHLKLVKKCKQKMANMLNISDNQHNLNICVPIIIILGYQLIHYFQENYQKTQKNKIQLTQQQQLQQDKQVDLHYILVKYISCHIAYLRAISQCYFSKYLTILTKQKKQKVDILLENLLNYWKSDKDSQKLMANMEITIQGFKKQMQIFQKQQNPNSFYLSFQRVYEHPSDLTKYFLNRDNIQILKNILNNYQINFFTYQIKNIFRKKIKKLEKQAQKFQKEEIQKLFLSKNNLVNQLQQNKYKENKKNNKSKKVKKAYKKQEQKVINDIQGKQVFTNIESFKYIHKIFKKQYSKCQNLQQPSVIIIATLLQKVHNFGYLVRTLTQKNAMLVVPSRQPFLHPQCIQLMPPQDQIDVKVIQLKNKNLQSFIKMYQIMKYPLIALEQCSKSIELGKIQFPQKYMLLLGNQRIGAPAALLNLADILVQIPQIGKIRSLNVHVSMVICFWEYLKQHDKNLNPQQKFTFMKQN